MSSPPPPPPPLNVVSFCIEPLDNKYSIKNPRIMSTEFFVVLDHGKLAKDKVSGLLYADNKNPQDPNATVRELYIYGQAVTLTDSKGVISDRYSALLFQITDYVHHRRNLTLYLFDTSITLNKMPPLDAKFPEAFYVKPYIVVRNQYGTHLTTSTDFRSALEMRPLQVSIRTVTQPISQKTYPYAGFTASGRLPAGCTNLDILNTEMVNQQTDVIYHPTAVTVTKSGTWVAVFNLDKPPTDTAVPYNFTAVYTPGNIQEEITGVMISNTLSS